jgi:hypothetical protein
MIFHGSIHPLLRGGTGTALPYLGWLLKPKPRKDNAVSMDEIIIHKGYDAEIGRRTVKFTGAQSGRVRACYVKRT